MTSPDTEAARVAEIADRVEAGDCISNSLDAEIEMALFDPPEDGFVAVRQNSAATKLIYTRDDGGEQTCLAWDWTMDRPRAVQLLRARAAHLLTKDHQNGR